MMTAMVSLMMPISAPQQPMLPLLMLTAAVRRNDRLILILTESMTILTCVTQHLLVRSQTSTGVHSRRKTRTTTVSPTMWMSAPILQRIILCWQTGVLMKVRKKLIGMMMVTQKMTNTCLNQLSGLIQMVMAMATTLKELMVTNALR